MADQSSRPFWEEKRLDQMSDGEWESLCDGCGRCCLNKLAYEDSEEIDFTNIACRLLDDRSCRCRHYEQRKAHVPECVVLTRENVSDLGFMPETCAYRLLAEGQPLAWWHPLVSGNAESVHEAGISVRGKVVSEADVMHHDWRDFIIDWVTN